MDLIENNIDLAIRVNPSKNSLLVGKKLGDYKLVAVASSQYIKKHAKIKSVKDLLQHELLILDHHSSVFQSPKEFRDKRVFVTNDSPLLSQLILEGEGVGIRALWDAKELLATKKLVPVLPLNFFKSQGEVWLLSAPERLQSEAVRKLYDYLLAELTLKLS